MKYLVISDIHGSKSSADAVHGLLEVHGCSKILCLGDVLYHGPRNDLPFDYAPKEVISLLNPLAELIIGVRGNCDAEVDQMVLKFDVHSDYHRIRCGKRPAYITHGHLDQSRLFPLVPGSILLSGHTHIPVCEEKDGILFLNPGSMTLPKENHPRSYGILEDNSFSVMKLEDHEIHMRITF
ncbi:MAG: phosphodiesterase [Solobacterium sp.]|nr:phosphodiesterase [Solobacterium sp.]